MPLGAYYKIWWYQEIGQGRIVKFFRKPSAGNGRAFSDDVPFGDSSSEQFKTVKGDEAEQFNERMSQSISRTKSRIFELAGCNPWEWFFTGTLNPEWHNACNLESFRKKLSQYIRDCRKKYGTPCAFLLIPEQHKSGAWHVHGLLGGFPDTAFRSFSKGEVLPHKILKQLNNGDDIRDWTGYSKRFGFTTVSPIRCQAKCTSYVTKYITKDCYKTSISNGGHMFYASQGLKGKELAFEGKRLPLDVGNVVFGYSNDYVAIADIDKLPQSCLKGLISYDEK